LAFSEAGAAERGFGLPSRDSSAARRYAGRERLFDRRERGVLGGFRLCLALAFISFVNVVAAPRYPDGHSVAGYRGAIIYYVLHVQSLINKVPSSTPAAPVVCRAH
jgi:hypothetical protein